MEIFYITLFFSTLISYAGRVNGKRNELNRYFKEPNIIFFYITTSILILVSGLRWNIGDTYFYKHSYRLAGLGYDVGYEYAFNRLIIILNKISSDPQLLLLVTALITNLFILGAIKKYSTYFELSVYMYITSGYYLVTMNGIRQTLAASIFFYFGIKYIIEKKFIKYLILLGILSLFHSTVPFLLICYFFGQEKPWSKKMGLFIVGSLFGAVFYNMLIGVGAAVIGEYSIYLTNFNEGGAHILRIIISAVPVALAFYKREVLAKKWKFSNVFINISLLNFVFMIFSLHNWIFVRFSMYLSLVNLVLLPYIIKNCFKGNDRKILYIGCVVAYFVYFFYDQAITMGIHYRSVILGIY
ncbi:MULTISPECIES: EpsG family protein [Psychrilyobacter]|uniref:EpsG family protein n=1 Tax=Psychrilyobacter piezotolerans TaxID=2293438 RepID=A0ABX9KHZ7_9FUSO|nr:MULTISPECIES: EpsG family protein [Psychrilyobacter]MCS5420924.1 EpsG family protein [Psychrilyobacter sp. S5]NDI77669.1 EpsG family protein [Psychrilyobacter piezotolerans]RDE62676.1 EpsG family protein [Psychrilyobacter sp. S5]REI41606.1 EpsG family protein [Psychrilyobacter piezotolerans]